MLSAIRNIFFVYSFSLIVSLSTLSVSLNLMLLPRTLHACFVSHITLVCLVITII